MVKKVFALASMTTLVGLVAGITAAACSSTTIYSGPVDAGTDARREANRPEGGGDLELCYSEDPVDHARYVYKPPNQQPGVCSQADVDRILKFIDDNARATVADLLNDIRTNTPAACSACIMGEATADKWTPILLRDQQFLSVNSSGCVEIVSGKGEACGKAHRQWDQCIDEACVECVDEVDLANCQQEVQLGACAGASDALETACGSSINAYLEECRQFDRWILKHCGGTPADGGTTDAGTDAPQQ